MLSSLILTLCLGTVVYAQALPELDLQSIGFTESDLQCPMPAIRVLQNRMKPDVIKTIMRATQAAAFTNAGLHVPAAETLSAILSSELGGSWHVVIAVGPLDWHVKFDGDNFISFQFGGLAMVVFRRDRKEQILLPIDLIQKFIQQRVKELPDDVFNQPSALEAIVAVVEQNFGGQWQAVAAEAEKVAVRATTGALYQTTQKGKRAVALWTIDIPAQQITSIVGASSFRGRDDDLLFLQELLINGTGDTAGDILAKFQDAYKGDWTALSNVIGFSSNRDDSSLAVQIFDQSYVGAVANVFPVNYTTGDADSTYIQDYMNAMASQLAFISGDKLPALITENMHRKFGGSWTAVCGDKGGIKLKSTKKIRFHQVGADFGNTKKHCISWLTSNNPAVPLGTPRTNMFATMAADALKSIQDSILRNAGNKDASAKTIVNQMKATYGGEWHSTVSDSVMSVSVDINVINFLWIQSPDWTVAVMQSNVPSTAPDAAQLEYLTAEANTLVKAFFQGTTVGSNTATRRKRQVATNPDDSLRLKLKAKFGNDWITTVMVPGSYAIASTSDPLPIMSVTIKLDQTSFDVKALSLAPTVVIKDMQFIDLKKAKDVIAATNKALLADDVIKGTADMNKVYTDLCKTILSEMNKEYFQLKWNVFCGSQNTSSYSFWFDPPNWIVLSSSQADSNVVLFSRSVKSTFNASAEETKKGINGLLASIVTDGLTYSDISANLQRLISSTTSSQWQAVAGKVGSFAVSSTSAKYQVLAPSTDKKSTLGVWLA